MCACSEKPRGSNPPGAGRVIGTGGPGPGSGSGGRLALARLQAAQAPLLWAAALSLALAGREPFASWLYHFAWWPLLICLDGLLTLKGEPSLIWDRPREGLRLLGWSVTVWLVFEAFNLYLLNWRYADLEPRLTVRWCGYLLAFATVLPGIVLTARLLLARGWWSGAKGSPRRLRAWQPLSLMLGAACVVLPLLSPTYAFPLLWLGFIFLLDPLVDLLTGDSLLGRWLAGERREVYALLTAGLLLGFWWEFWNYPSLSRWIYTLPVLNFGKIFEMPVLGYLGFAPFALECAVMYSFLTALDRQVLDTPGRRTLAWMVQVLFWAVMFAAIDRVTVASFR